MWFGAHILIRITGKKIEETRFCFEKRESLFKIHFFAFLVPRRGSIDTFLLLLWFPVEGWNINSSGN